MSLLGKELVKVVDSGILRLRSKLGAAVAGREWDGSDMDKPLVEVRGWVKMVMRERGKIVKGSHREGSEIETVESWIEKASSYIKKGVSE